MAKPATGRREQNKQEKRGRIIAAARALFRHKGFDATTTQEIADAADIASGTLFTYAPTKDDLLILVFHSEMMSIVDDAYARAKEQTGLLEQVITFFDEMVVYHERDLPLARALMRQLGYVGSDDQRALVNELMTKLFGKLTRIVEAAKAESEVDASQPSYIAARAIFAIYYFHLGSMLNGFIDRTRFDHTLRTDLGITLQGIK